MPSFNSILVCCALVSVASVCVAAFDRVTVSRNIAEALSSPEETFKAWAVKHGKVYADEAEYQKRFAIWTDNAQYVSEYNQQHETHWLGLNTMADLTHDEFKTYPKGFNYEEQLRVEDLKLNSGEASEFMYADVDLEVLPEEIDWREKGAVTAVKNQEQCGSCWAFSTTGSVEGANFLKTGVLEVLSEQELVDCDTKHDNGCNGGLMDFAFKFIIDNGGIDTEADYKYQATNGVCNIKKMARDVVTIDSFQDVPRSKQLMLKRAVAHQPVSIAIQANEKAFQLYSGGVLTAECGTALDHGVLLAGYGRENNTDFWLVKNSWGGLWGEEGYIKLERTNAPGPGKCGVAMMPSFPVKTHNNPPRPPKPSPDPPTPPPPPPDAPVVCDSVNECMPGTTCCCMQELSGMCLDWACCPLPKATCCKDRRHCCPHTLPICDMAHSRCLPKGADYTDYRAEPMQVKVAPLKRTFGRANDIISSH